ncbi:MAG: transcription termination factor NusA [Chloroflexota bacterium]
MKNEFALAFNEVLEEKGLPKEVVVDALQAALASAYRRHVNASNAQHVDAVIDIENGKVTIYAEKEVVESVEDERTEVALKDAQKVDKDAALGSMVVVESTPRNFGRVAAQTARQVIQQRIREAERENQTRYFGKQMGEIISGVVQAVNAQGVTLGMEMKAEGVMPRNQMIPGERFRVHDRARALLLEVKTSPRGPQIILSRAHRNFLRRLLENEVPEIYHGMVEIRSIAREPGQRSKVAVAALQTGVDPVGACVGIRGVRIQAIVRELNDEKIDVIEWSQDPAVYIAKALSPARVSGVYLNDQVRGVKTATVVVPEDQLSLAIGRDGQNARLAAKLTAWKIDIKSLPEASSDALNKLLSDPEYAVVQPFEKDTIPQVEAVLAKKAEGRPVTPEEYHVLTQFVDRVERGVMRQRREDVRAEEERFKNARAQVPASAFEVPIEKFEISDRVFAVISETGMQTLGDVMLQMKVDPDAILKLSGMGPKAMIELQTALDRAAEKLVPPAEPEPEPVEAQAAPVEVEAEAEAEQPEPAAEPATEPAAEPAAEVVEEPLPVEAEAVVEAAAELEPVVETPAGVSETPAQPEDEEAGSFDELFAMRTESETESTEEETEDETDDKKKKKKSKKKFVEMTYDPDRDAMVVKKKRKRGTEDWTEETW